VLLFKTFFLLSSYIFIFNPINMKMVKKNGLAIQLIYIVSQTISYEKFSKESILKLSIKYLYYLNSNICITNYSNTYLKYLSNQVSVSELTYF